MSVGDSAEELISIHALGRVTLLVLSCGLPSHPLKILFFARWESIESFCLSFLHFARWESIESFCLSFLHNSRQTCLQQKHDRRSPQITGRRVSAVHQEGVGAPNELATFRVHDDVIEFVEVCGEHEIAHLIQICLRISQADVGQDRREKLFFRTSGKLKKKIYQIGSIGDRSGKVWLGSSFLALHCHRSEREDKRQIYLLLLAKFNRRTKTHNPTLSTSITRSWARPARGRVLGALGRREHTRISKPDGLDGGVRWTTSSPEHVETVWSGHQPWSWSLRRAGHERVKTITKGDTFGKADDFRIAFEWNMLRDSRQSKADKRVSGGRANLYRCTGAAIAEEECSCCGDG